jgi:hypothetical protein
MPQATPGAADASAKLGTVLRMTRVRFSGVARSRTPSIMFVKYCVYLQPQQQAIDSYDCIDGAPQHQRQRQYQQELPQHTTEYPREPARQRTNKTTVTTTHTEHCVRTGAVTERRRRRRILAACRRTLGQPQECRCIPATPAPPRPRRLFAPHPTVVKHSQHARECHMSCVRHWRARRVDAPGSVRRRRCAGRRSASSSQTCTRGRWWRAADTGGRAASTPLAAWWCTHRTRSYTDPEPHKHTDTQTHRHTDTDTDTDTHTGRARHTRTHTERERERERGRKSQRRPCSHRHKRERERERERDT